jgi:hypothetical protein
MMAQQAYEMLVVISTPTDFLALPDKQKLRFYDQAVSWHDYISDLKERGVVTDAWGAEKLLSTTTGLSPTKSVLSAIYSVESLKVFSEALSQDPLFQFGQYLTIPLTSIEEDYETDLARYRQSEAYVRSRGKQTPDAVVRYPHETPWIKARDPRAGAGLEIMVLIGSTFGDWRSDEQNLEFEETILQMHDYHGRLRDAGIIRREWGSHQFVGAGAFATARPVAAIIFDLDSHDEFDQVFSADPLWPNFVFLTLALVPFDESRRRATQELHDASSHLTMR